MNYYDEAQPDCTISVLGVDYGVYGHVSREDDKFLERCDGYFDKTAKRVVVAGEDGDNELADFEAYRKTNLRHELIHAFLYESGLDGNSRWHNDEDEHPEQTVEWLAIQFPKMIKAFMEADAL